METREAAVRQIPWEKLSPNNRQRVLQVVNRAAIFRRMPSRAIQCEPDFYRFLVENPDVVVGIWQVLGVTKIRLEPRGPNTFFLDDAAGTVAQLQYILGSPSCHVLYGEGQYSGPLMLRPLQGRCVIVVNSSYIREKDGTAYVSATLDLFVQVDRGGIELLTKALNPLFGTMAENNYRQTFAFLGALYRTAVVRGTALRHLASQAPNISPDVRDKFLTLVAEAGRRESARLQQGEDGTTGTETAEKPALVGETEVIR